MDSTNDHVIAWRHKTCKSLVGWLESRGIIGWDLSQRWFCPSCGPVTNEDVERVKLPVIAVEADDGE